MRFSSPIAVTERENERAQKGISRHKLEAVSSPAAEIRFYSLLLLLLLQVESIRSIHPTGGGERSGLRGIQQILDITPQKPPSASSELCISEDGREPDPRCRRTGSPGLSCAERSRARAPQKGWRRRDRGLPLPGFYFFLRVCVKRALHLLGCTALGLGARVSRTQFLRSRRDEGCPWRSMGFCICGRARRRESGGPLEPWSALVRYNIAWRSSARPSHGWARG